MDELKEIKPGDADYMAYHIEMIFRQCALLIPYIDQLETAEENFSKNESLAVAGAVVFEALGVNYRERESTYALYRKRTQALINLLNVLKETEFERIRMNEEKSNIEEIRKNLGI